MFPVGDVIPSRTRPVVTVGLITLTSAAFFYELALDGAARQAFVSPLSVTPAELVWPAVVASLFLHAGWLHVASNMLYLWIFGATLEDLFGHGRFLLFYVACGTLASAAHVAIHPSSVVPMLGAGGAVAGVMGAYLVLYPRSRVLTAMLVVRPFDFVEVPAIFYLGVWFMLQLFTGAGSIVAGAGDGALAFWAHVTGFVAGGICGAYSRFGTASLQRYWR